LGASAPPGASASAVVASALELIGAGQGNDAGVVGLSEAVDAGEFLDVLATQGVACQEFVGT